MKISLLLMALMPLTFAFTIPNKTNKQKISSLSSVNSSVTQQPQKSLSLLAKYLQNRKLTTAKYKNSLVAENRRVRRSGRHTRGKTTDFSGNKRQDDTQTTPDDRYGITRDAELDKCNSPALKKLMLQNTDKSTSLSKRRINKKAEEVFGGNVDVICSRGHFSYIYSSNLYCETTKEGITCVAYRQVHK